MKLVIFDIDGTLTDTKMVEDKCFFRAFEQTFGIDISGQAWEDIQNVTDWGIIEELIQTHCQRLPTVIEYEQMQQCFFQCLREELAIDPTQFREVPGALAFFETLQADKNFTVGIATGAWSGSARIKLAAIGIDPTGLPFSNSDFFKSREQITKHAIAQAMATYQNEFEDIIYFGDGAWDFKTCRNLAIRFIGIDVLGDGKLKRLGAKTVFQNFQAKATIRTSL